MYNLASAEGANIILYIILLLSLLVSWLFIILLLRKIKSNKLTHELERELLEVQHRKALDRHVTQSRNVLKGKISEELFPLLRDCPYLPADLKFLGMPVDYIIFNGYSEAKDNNGDFAEIVFADIKTGNARLSPHQRKIKQAVIEGRVRWETIRMHDDGSIVFERD